jgi:lysophospholipid hydrolase
MLHYSFTISLTFPVLLTLFLASCGAAFFVIRYRYLARYTQLKEPALPPPSPPSLPADLPDLDLDGLPSDLHPARLQGARRRNSAFHNYLDDFLSAIRIFGYLEKPVFHELSRHLQTRRLGAGETLEIGGGDFWCVVEGKVQVVRLFLTLERYSRGGLTSSLPLPRAATFHILHPLILSILAKVPSSTAITC